MAQLLLLASLHEAWGSRGGALGARVPEERLSALFLAPPTRSYVLPPQLENTCIATEHRAAHALLYPSA